MSNRIISMITAVLLTAVSASALATQPSIVIHKAPIVIIEKSSSPIIIFEKIWAAIINPIVIIEKG